MEQKKFNNAIEKTEKLSEDTQKVKFENQNAPVTAAIAKGKIKTAKTDNAKKIGDNKKTNNAKKATDDKKALKREKDKKAALAAKQKREEEAAKIRMQKAEKKAALKEERKKLRMAKKQAALRKRESIKQLRIKKREERLARRDMLKHESKEQRQERILAEKKAKNDFKMEKRRQKAEIKREKQRALKEKRAQKATERREKRQIRSSRGLGGWLAAVISLGVVCLILSTVLVWDLFMTGGGQNMLDGIYAKSFYDLVGYVDNIDVNLSKLTVSNDGENSRKIVSDIMVQASLAENDLQTLPLGDESGYHTVKFINQLGDFAKYLNNKLIEGGTITEEDLALVNQFKKINAALKSDLNDLNVAVGDDYDFTAMLSEKDDNVVLKKFGEIESNAVDYPQMIYDGPFADKPEVKASDKKENGSPIDEEQAKEKVTSYLSDYELDEVKVTGMGEGEYFKVYNLTAAVKGATLNCQITESGELVMMDWFMDCKDKNFTRDECIESAEQFLEKCGYKSIKPVWVSENGTTVYVNFAAREHDDIIVYADMIKVSVCAERGMVYSFDATAYVENHTEREILEPKLTVYQAESKLSLNIDVQTSRLAYIPLENGKERLAYEFFGSGEDGDFYIYIDALSGRELQIFKVINTDEGVLLL